MAAGTMSAPGTEYGPCVDENCGHTTCDETRRMVGLECRYCETPIGYDRRFFNDTLRTQPLWSVLVHELCAYEAIDAANAHQNEANVREGTA